MMKQYYIELFTYNEWANQLAYKSVADTTDVNERARDLLSHIVAAQKIWLSRATGKGDYPMMPWDKIPFNDFPLLSKQINEDWKTFIEELPEEKFYEVISYKTIAGGQFKNKIADVITHVINHSTYHRGQIASLVKAAGGKPAITDYIFYKRG